MIETLLMGGEPIVIPTGDVLFLYDPATNKDLITNTVCGALKASTTVDTTVKIDGNDTLKFAAAGAGAVLTFPSGINLNALTEWTIEWSSRPTAIGVSYFTEIFLDTTPSSGVPLGCRWTDGGYGDKLQFNIADFNNARLWRPPFAKPAVVNKLTKYSMVYKGGVVKVYVDGALQTLTNGVEGNGVSQAFISKTQSWGVFTNLTLGYFNSANVAWLGNFGRIRISNFARYLGTHTPPPF